MICLRLDNMLETTVPGDQYDLLKAGYYVGDHCTWRYYVGDHCNLRLVCWRSLYLEINMIC